MGEAQSGAGVMVAEPPLAGNVLGMTRIRWAALTAAILLVLVGGFNAYAGGRSGRVAAIPVEAPSGSLSAGADGAPPALVAVEGGRVAAVARPDGPLGARWLATTLLALLVVTAARRLGPRRQRLLELAIRCRTEWWRPTPGGRAPPRLLAA